MAQQNLCKPKPRKPQSGQRRQSIVPADAEAGPLGFQRAGFDMPSPDMPAETIE